MSGSNTTRSLAGRIGAHRLHATHDSRETTAIARAAFLDRFEREVDPEGLLSVQDRACRADHARKAYFTRLSLRSAQARARRRSRSSSFQREAE
jgi:hypothetical protein